MNKFVTVVTILLLVLAGSLSAKTAHAQWVKDHVEYTDRRNQVVGDVYDPLRARVSAGAMVEKVIDTESDYDPDTPKIVYRWTGTGSPATGTFTITIVDTVEGDVGGAFPVDMIGVWGQADSATPLINGIVNILSNPLSYFKYPPSPVRISVVVPSGYTASTVRYGVQLEASAFVVVGVYHAWVYSQASAASNWGNMMPPDSSFPPPQFANNDGK